MHDVLRKVSILEAPEELQGAAGLTGDSANSDRHLDGRVLRLELRHCPVHMELACFVLHKDIDIKRTKTFYVSRLQGFTEYTGSNVSLFSSHCTVL